MNIVKLFLQSMWLSSNPYLQLAFLPQPVTRNLFAPNIFGKEALLEMISSATLLSELKHGAAFSHGRQPEVRCFRI